SEAETERSAVGEQGFGVLAQPMVIEREDPLEHFPRHAAEKAVDRSHVKRRSVGGRERVLAAASAYERQPMTVAGEEIDADRYILRIMLEAVDDTMRISEQNAGKGAQRRALARLVETIDEVQPRCGAEVERIAGKVAIGTQVEPEDAHHASSS